MSVVLDETGSPSSDVLKHAIHLDLSKADVALIIDALLQAEMTLPLIDRRYRAMKAIEALRAKQLLLANRLEDLMSGSIGEISAAGSQPGHDGAGREA